MKAKFMILFLALALVLSPSAYALKMVSGNEAIIDTPINDDIFAAGNAVTINAPVSGAVVAGNAVRINALVYGDTFAAGNQISINADTGGKIVAAGDTIDIKGDARNLVIAGNTVTIHQSATIEKDAVIAARTVINAGKVTGNLTVRAETFENTGTAGHVDFVQMQRYGGAGQALSALGIIMAIGLLILGMILVALLPAQFSRVDEEIRNSAAEKTVAGFVLIIASMILIFLLALTIIGIPIAIFAALLFAVALVLSMFFVSYSLGRTIAGRESKSGNVLIFAVGFIILSIIFRLPLIGGLVCIIAISLGYGALYYAIRANMRRAPAKGRTRGMSESEKITNA